MLNCCAGNSFCRRSLHCAHISSDNADSRLILTATNGNRWSIPSMLRLTVGSFVIQFFTFLPVTACCRCIPSVRYVRAWHGRLAPPVAVYSLLLAYFAVLSRLLMLPFPSCLCTFTDFSGIYIQLADFRRHLEPLAANSRYSIARSSFRSTRSFGRRRVERPGRSRTPFDSRPGRQK